jgi:hypothetical protein
MLQKPPHSCFLFVNFNYLLITSISKAIYPAGFAAFWGFCSGINLKFEDWKNTTLLSLKKIPSCDGNGIDVCQLVGCEYILTPLVGSDGLAELWSGIGSVSYYKNVLQNFAPVISPSPGVS